MAGDEMPQEMPMEEPMEEAAPEGSKFQEVVKAAAELRNMADRLESLVTVADLPKMAMGGMANNPAIVGEEGPEMVTPVPVVDAGAMASVAGGGLRDMERFREGTQRLMESARKVRLNERDVPSDMFSAQEKKFRETGMV